MINNNHLRSWLLTLTCLLAYNAPLSAAGADGSPGISEVREKLLDAADTEKGGDYVRSRFLKIVKQPFANNDTRKKLLLIGDSHAQDFYNAVLEQGALQNYQIRTRYVPTRCQMYLGNEDVSGFVSKKDRKLCDSSDTLAAIKREVLPQADVVILAAKWSEWSAKRLPESLKNLQLQAEQQLVVIGRKSFGGVKVRKYLRLSADKLRNYRNPVDTHQQPINKLMRNTLPDTQFVDMQKVLCDNDKTCPLFTEQLELISFDGGHLTKAGAVFAGKRLFERSLLKDL